MIVRVSYNDPSIYNPVFIVELDNDLRVANACKRIGTRSWDLPFNIADGFYPFDVQRYRDAEAKVEIIQFTNIKRHINPMSCLNLINPRSLKLTTLKDSELRQIIQRQLVNHLCRVRQLNIEKEFDDEALDTGDDLVKEICTANVHLAHKITRN